MILAAYANCRSRSDELCSVLYSYQGTLPTCCRLFSARNGLSAQTPSPYVLLNSVSSTTMPNSEARDRKRCRRRKYSGFH